MQSSFVRRSSIVLAVLSAVAAACSDTAGPRPDTLASDALTAAAEFDSLMQIPILGWPGGFRDYVPRPFDSMGFADTIQGKTFVWDSASSLYVVGPQSGAPATGARFLLYAFQLRGAGMGGPPTMLQVGYSDVAYDTVAGAPSIQAAVIADSITYLNLSASRFDSSGIVGVSEHGVLRRASHRYPVSIVATKPISGTSDETLVETIDDSASGWRLVFTYRDSQGSWDYVLSRGTDRVEYSGTITSSTESLTLSLRDTAIALFSRGSGQSSLTGINGHVLTDRERALAAQLEGTIVNTWSLGFNLASDGGVYLNCVF